MSLKPIPEESCCGKCLSVKKVSLKSQQKKLREDLRSRLKQKDLKHEAKVLNLTCLRLVDYLTENRKFSVDEIDTLIDGMHRCTSYLSKKKVSLMKKQRKKK